MQLKGSTTVYAMTDDLGGYSITVPSNGVLVVSFLGYKTVEIPVNGRTTIDVALEFEAEKPPYPVTLSARLPLPPSTRC